MSRILKNIFLFSVMLFFVSGCGSDDTPKESEREYGLGENRKVIMFYHDKCPPCIKALPIWSEVEAEYPYITFEKVNILNNPARAEEYDVTNIPLIVLEIDGQKVAEQLGLEKETFIHFIHTEAN